MSTLTVTRSYDDGEDLTESQLDDAFDSIETWAAGNIGSTNIASGGVEAANLASSAVTATKIASDAVTTAKILDANVTGAKLDTSCADASTLEVASGSMRIKDLGVTTAKINTGAVTQAKRAALGQQLGSGLATSQTTTSTTAVDITGCSISITTTGRPVFIALQAYGDTNLTSFPSTGEVQLVKDSTNIARYRGDMGPLFHIDVPTAGTYTYKWTMKSLSGSSVGGQFLNIIAFEL